MLRKHIYRVKFVILFIPFILIQMADYWKIIPVIPQEFSPVFAGDVGGDFASVYMWANALRAGAFSSVSSLSYPPFTVILFGLFSLLSFSHAYYLICLIVVAAWCVVWILSISFCCPLRSSPVYPAIFGAVLTIFTYPLLLALCRGNIDVVVGLLMCLYLRAIFYRWHAGGIIALTIATQMKLYPVILCLWLALQNRWKEFWAFVVLNTALLFCLGYSSLVKFIGRISQAAIARAEDQNNHSLAVFSVNLSGNNTASFEIWFAIVSFVMVFFLFLTVQHFRPDRVRLISSVFQHRLGNVGLVGMAFCLMCLVPPISYDYKLSLMIIPALMLGEMFLRHRCSYLVLTIFGAVWIGTAALFITDLAHQKAPRLLVLFALYAIIVLVAQNWAGRLGSPIVSSDAQ